MLTKLIVVLTSLYIYIPQVITLYTLSVYSVICQLYLSEAENRKSEGFGSTGEGEGAGEGFPEEGKLELGLFKGEWTFRVEET